MFYFWNIVQVSEANWPRNKAIDNNETVNLIKI